MSFAPRVGMAAAAVWLGLIGFAVSSAPCLAEAIRIDALKVPVPNSGSAGHKRVYPQMGIGVAHGSSTHGNLFVPLPGDYSIWLRQGYPVVG